MMHGILFADKPGARQLFRDARTKIILCITMPMLLRQFDAPVFSIISGALAAIFTQMLPGLAMFDVLLSSTTVSEFIGAMDGFHISKKFSVPVSVMFRFFPTIKEEYGMIRDALRRRKAEDCLRFCQYASSANLCFGRTDLQS